MTHKCELFDQVAQPTLSIRTRAAVQDLPKVVGESYAAIGQFLASHGEEPGGAPYVAYFNMDMQDLDLEIGFPVSHPIAGEGAIQPGEMPAGRYASILHKGAYTELGSSYRALHEFIQETGLQPTGLAYEFYLNSPREVQPDQLKTQIVFPIVSN